MLKHKKIYLFVLLILLLPAIVMAGPDAGGGGAGGANTGANWVFNIINNLLYMVVWPVFVAISIGMFGWAGFLYLTAQGDVVKVSTAHKAVAFAVVGIIIVLLSYGYMNYLRNNLNRGGGGGGGGGGGTSGACCVPDPPGTPNFVCIDAGGASSCTGYGGDYKGDNTTCTNPGVSRPTCEWRR